MLRSVLPSAQLLLWSWLICSCSGDTSAPPPAAAALALVGGDAQSGTVATALGAPLVVEVRDERGRPLPHAAVAWRVTVGAGVVKALAAESDANGHASAEWVLGTGAGEQRAEATLGALIPVAFHATATPGPVAVLTAKPDTVRFTAIGDSALLTASAADSYGNRVTDAVITWTTPDLAVLGIAGGIVRGKAGGTGRVIARSGTAADTVVVLVVPEASAVRAEPRADTVNALGRTRQFTATLRDRNGNALPGTVAWTSLDTAIATVAANGAARGVAAGLARLRASFGPLADTVALRVRQVIAAMVVNPRTVTLGVGGRTGLTVSAADSGGTNVPGTPAWSASPAGIVDVDTDGQVTARAAGTATVTASLPDGAGGTRSAIASVTVAASSGARLVLAPTDWRLPAGAQVQLRAAATGTSLAQLDWSVNDILGGNAAVGTISADGMFRAPSSLPALGRVTVAAALRADPAVRAEVPITITPAAVSPVVLQLAWDRRAVRAGVTDSARLEVDLAGDGRLELLLGAERVPLQPVRTGRLALTLPRTTLLRTYQVGDLHAFVGYLELTPLGSGGTRRYNMFVDVVDATVPAAPVTPVAADAQASTHVVNLQVEDTSHNVTAAIRRFYQLYPDDYDFLAVVRQVHRFENRYYQGVRNNTSGIGISAYNYGASYGSAARLQGIVNYPIDGFFDLGETAASHELGHRWLVFLKNFTGNAAHWPMSDLARGVMGFAIGGAEGGTFQFDVVPLPDGRVRVDCATALMTFTDLDLYAMGLLPPDSVADHFILGTQSALPACGSIMSATRLRMSDVIAANGIRNPSSGAAQRDFRIATIVLSLGRLLSQDEMDFFDHLAARGEAREPLHFTSGFSSGTTLPFYLATGGRATLTSRLR